MKVRAARRFLSEHHKVKVTMNFRGREVTHADIGKRILEEVAEMLADVASVESSPRMEGRNMLMLLTPRASVVKKKSEAAEESKEG